MSINEFVIAIALFTTAPPHHQQDVYSPWRMGDWVECRDGSQFYQDQEACLEHDGLRAHGPGKRLDEK